MMKLPCYFHFYNRHDERQTRTPLRDDSIHYRDYFARGYTPRAVSWREREQARFNDEVYMRPPGWFPTLPEHFAHPNVLDPRLISFIENDKKGEADVRVSIKPGRYIERFFSDTHDAQVLGTKWAAAYRPEELRIAKTADEIERVFLIGPRSCMFYPASYFKDNAGATEHPVRMYGDSDLQLAYIERDKRVTARVLIWPEQKLYGRVYGDSFRIIPLLMKEGYKEGDFINATVNCKPLNKGVLVPYIDRIARGSFHNKERTKIILDNKGPIKLQNQYGVANSTGKFCDFVGEWLADDQFRRVYIEGPGRNSQYWSLPRIEAQAFQDIFDGNFYPNGLKVSLGDNEACCTYNAENYTNVCAGNGKRYRKELGTELKKAWYSLEYIRSKIETHKKAA